MEEVDEQDCGMVCWKFGGEWGIGKPMKMWQEDDDGNKTSVLVKKWPKKSLQFIPIGMLMNYPTSPIPTP